MNQHNKIDPTTAKILQDLYSLLIQNPDVLRGIQTQIDQTFPPRLHVEVEDAEMTGTFDLCINSAPRKVKADSFRVNGSASFSQDSQQQPSYTAQSADNKNCSGGPHNHNHENPSTTASDTAFDKPETLDQTYFCGTFIACGDGHQQNGMKIHGPHAAINFAKEINMGQKPVKVKD